jgi:hypothetical protein
MLLSEGLVPEPATGPLRPYGLVLLALAYTPAGRTGAADRALAEADRAEPADGPGILAELTELARAELLLARGRHGGALRLAAGVAERRASDPGLLVAALHLASRIQPSPAGPRPGSPYTGMVGEPALARRPHRESPSPASGCRSPAR